MQPFWLDSGYSISLPLLSLYTSVFLFCFVFLPPSGSNTFTLKSQVLSLPLTPFFSFFLTLFLPSLSLSDELRAGGERESDIDNFQETKVGGV